MSSEDVTELWPRSLHEGHCPMVKPGFSPLTAFQQAEMKDSDFYLAVTLPCHSPQLHSTVVRNSSSSQMRKQSSCREVTCSRTLGGWMLWLRFQLKALSCPCPAPHTLPGFPGLWSVIPFCVSMFFKMIPIKGQSYPSHQIFCLTPSYPEAL